CPDFPLSPRRRVLGCATRASQVRRTGGADRALPSALCGRLRRGRFFRVLFPHPAVSPGGPLPAGVVYFATWGGGGLSGPPPGRPPACGREGGRRGRARPPASGCTPGRSAALKQHAPRRAADRTLRRRIAAHGATHRARLQTPAGPSAALYPA